MPCFRPLRGYRSRLRTKNGKSGIVFSAASGFVDQPLEVPCGQCIGCRLERSRQWAIRCVHEASLYERNCFLTLTYDDAHLPVSHSLDKTAFPKFMKRLRQKYFRGRKSDVRYFSCGEYGELFGRPHYHACVFNFDFEDKKLFKYGEGGEPLYTSEALQSLWPFGHCTIGEVTFESAAYVARYVMKKITGKDAASIQEDGSLGPYVHIDEATGEMFEREPEYTTMSRRPGIGTGWVKKYKTDVYPGDFVVIRGGLKCTPPKFYDRLLSEAELEKYKRGRKIRAVRRKEDNTPQRLRVRERVTQARIKQLKRSLD